MSDHCQDAGGRDQEIAAAHLSIAGAMLIFLISSVCGILTDSVALLIDAATGLVILVVAFFVRFIIRKIDSPPDPDFHFGYGKYEPLTVVLQNIAILTTCFFGVKFAIQDLVHPEDITNYLLPVAASFVSGCLAAGLGLYLRGVALRRRSEVLKTSGAHWFVDSALSFGMCAGFLFAVFLRRAGYGPMAAYVDPVMAIILCLLMMRLPLRSISENVSELLDAVPAGEIQHRVRKMMEHHKPGPCSLHRVRLRKAGKRLFADVCFFVRGEMPVHEAESLADQFKRDLAADLPHCDVIVFFKSSAI